MADQIMTVDKKRLKTKIDTLSKSDLRDVEAAILVQLGLPKWEKPANNAGSAALTTARCTIGTRFLMSDVSLLL